MGLDYINKNKTKGAPTEKPIAQTSNRVDGIRGLDLRSNIQKYSAVVTRNGVVLQQINLLTIRDWVASNATLLVNFIDTPYPLILVFLTEIDQIQGQIRLTNMMNGQLIL